jgi:PST family polysaccharide transporter
MGTALVLNKVLAVYVGPAGYATIGQFQNAMTMAIGLATGATNTGITAITAEHFDDEARQRALWRTAGTVVICASLASAVLIILLRHVLARELLNDASLAGVFVALAVSLTFISLNALLLAILNGKKDVRRFVVSNIAGSLLSLGLVGVLAWRYGLYGALVSLSVYQGIAFVVTLQQTLSAPWFRLRDLVGKLDPVHLKSLSHFMLMAVTASVISPLCLVLVRNHIGETFGWDHAGYWDAMWKISGLYLTFITSTLSLYYLPRIAETRTNDELRREVWLVARLVLPAVVALALATFAFRHLIVRLLFSSDFQPMEQLFAWQMAGDVVKIASWILSFVMLGRGMTRLFVTTEIGFSILFWVLTVQLSSFMGFKGVSAAYFVCYSIYLVTMYYFIIHKSSAVKGAAEA